MPRVPINFAQASASVPTDDEEAFALRRQILDLTRRYAQIAHAPKPFVAGESRVLVSGKVYDGADMSSLVDSSLDFWLTTGRFGLCRPQIFANGQFRFVGQSSSHQRPLFALPEGRATCSGG
jgi:hypothetical protein